MCCKLFQHIRQPSLNSSMTRKDKRTFQALSIPDRAKWLLNKPMTTKITINTKSLDLEVLAIVEGIALPGAYKSEAEAMAGGLELLNRLAGKSPEIRAPRAYNRDRKAMNNAKWRALNPSKMRELNRRWCVNNPEKRLKSKEKYYDGWENAKCRRNPWDDIEDCLIMDRTSTDSQLSLKLGRSIMAIHNRRKRLKKLNAKEMNGETIL